MTASAASWPASTIAISLYPVFLGFAFHCRFVAVLHLEPIGRAARTIGRVLSLRDNAFEPELAGLAKYGLTVTFHVLVKSDGRASLSQDHLKRGFAAL
jgi:hypothetical protein